MLWTATTFTSENESSDDTPSMSVMLVMQLPNRFPRARLTSLCLSAWIVVANSGKEVPRPIMVAPMIDVGSPTVSAMSIELSTATLESVIINIMPITNFIVTLVIFCSVICWDVLLIAVFSVLREIVSPK